MPNKWRVSRHPSQLLAGGGAAARTAAPPTDCPNRDHALAQKLLIAAQLESGYKRSPRWCECVAARVTADLALLLPPPSA